MMGMPYLLLSSFGLYMYLEVRKARARDAAAKVRGNFDPTKPLAPAAAVVAVPTEPSESDASSGSSPMLFGDADATAQHADAGELAEV
jgi:hypothetical protein